MAGAKNHDYHILPPDIWPLIGAIAAALTLTSGSVLYMHDMPSAKYVLLLGVVGVLLTMFSLVVQRGAGKRTAATTPRSSSSTCATG